MDILLPLTLLLILPSLSQSRTLTAQTSTITYPIPSSIPSPSPTLIQYACKYCYDDTARKFCEQTLEADAAASKATTTLVLGQATLDLMIRNASDAQRLIANYSKKQHSMPRKLRDALGGCAEGYMHVVRSFESARGELDGAADTANYDVYESLDSVVACEEGLAATGLAVPSVSAKNGLIRSYISVGLAVTSFLFDEQEGRRRPPPPPPSTL